MKQSNNNDIPMNQNKTVTKTNVSTPSRSRRERGGGKPHRLIPIQNNGFTSSFINPCGCSGCSNGCTGLMFSDFSASLKTPKSTWCAQKCSKHVVPDSTNQTDETCELRATSFTNGVARNLQIGREYLVFCNMFVPRRQA